MKKALGDTHRTLATRRPIADIPAAHSGSVAGVMTFVAATPVVAMLTTSASDDNTAAGSPADSAAEAASASKSGDPDKSGPAKKKAPPDGKVKDDNGFPVPKGKPVADVAAGAESTDSAKAAATSSEG